MSLTSALVFFAVIWALIFYMIMPLGQTSQQEAGEVEPGTPASAPIDARVGRKAIVTTAIAAVVFAILYVVIEFRVITLDDLQYISPPSAQE
ncbi:MAG: DUF1467 family protein [Pseudomonadota bacterium]